MEEARWGAVLQAVKGCAAHDSGQGLTFEGQTCSLGRSFTTYDQENGQYRRGKVRGRTHPVTYGVYLPYRLFKDSSTKSYGEEKPNRYSTNNNPVVDCKRQTTSDKAKKN